MSHVFISYSTRDSTYAIKLAEKLRAEGFDVWIDNRRLRSSEDWWHSIVLAIEGCAAFVVLLTPASDDSKWVQREITLADQRNKPTFPLLLAGDTNTPNWALFVRTQYEDVRNGQLPDPTFFDKLADHAPRKRGQKGANVVRARRPSLPTDDPALQAALNTPPPPETKPARRSRGCLLFEIMLIIVLVAGAILLINNPDIVPALLNPPEPAPEVDLSPEEHLARGVEARAHGDIDLAIDHLSSVLESSREPALLADANRELGALFLQEGDFEAAMFHLNQAGELVPDRPETYRLLGELFEQIGDPHAALENYHAYIGASERYGLLMDEDLLRHIEALEREIAG